MEDNIGMIDSWPFISPPSAKMEDITGAYQRAPIWAELAGACLGPGPDKRGIRQPSSPALESRGHCVRTRLGPFIPKQVQSKK